MEKIRQYLKESKYKIDREKVGQLIEIQAPRGARLAIKAHVTGGYNVLNESSVVNTVPIDQDGVVTYLQNFLINRR